MKRLLIIVCAMLLVTALYGQMNERERIVILNMKGISVEKDFADIITESLITSFVKIGIYQIVERSQLEQILGELRLTSGDDFNDNVALKIGELSRAKLVIIGSVGKAGSSYLLNIRTISVETGNVVSAERVVVKTQDELILGTDEVARNITQKEIEDARKKVDAERQKADQARFEEEQKHQAEIDAENRQKQILIEEAANAEKKKKIEYNKQQLGNKPLVVPGGVLLTAGLLASVTGIVVLGVDFGYLMPLSDGYKKDLINSDPNVLSYDDYESRVNRYNESYNSFIGIFTGGIVSLGLGVISAAVSIPLLAYSKKNNISFHIESGREMVFAVQLQF